MCVFPPAAGNFAPLAIGLGLAGLIYSCGHISKAHFNPAITIAYLTARGLPKKEFVPYLLAEFSAAASAAVVIGYLKADYSEWISGLAAPEIPPLMLAEVLFTFILAWVILNVAIARGTAGNNFHGLAIGAIVLAGAYAVGPISLAALNPAVTFGFCINGLISWQLFPVYFIAQGVGAVMAALLFNYMLLGSSKAES